MLNSLRKHIVFYGLRNAGKSSLVNAIAGQDVALVSPIKGTTTDPVQKSMEILPLGPVVLIDTPGIDDTGDLGSLRVDRAEKTIDKTDLAVLVLEGDNSLSPLEQKLCKKLQERNIPFLVVHNKADTLTTFSDNTFYVSAQTGQGITELKEKIAHLLAQGPSKKILTDLIEPRDIVILVTPIDESAPKNRLILPQQMVLREVLDTHAIPILVQPEELLTLPNNVLKSAKLVITDSQAFQKVNKLLPQEIPLTSFSILMARFKGTLNPYLAGCSHLDQLKDNDTILIAEGCTHHRQCQDIGTVKLPKWIQDYTKKALHFEFCSGNDFPKDLSPYALVVHCGGCMLTEQEMTSRALHCANKEIPLTNYGMLIAKIHGILPRVLEPLGL